MSIEFKIIDTFPAFVDLVDMYGAICRLTEASSTCRSTLSAPTMTFRLCPRPRTSRPSAVLKACVEARAALAELKISGQLIPNPSVLINSIPLLEAQASSEIENIVTTADRLFRFANRPEAGVDPATKEALRYRTALYQGFKNSRASRFRRGAPLKSVGPSRGWTSISAQPRARR